MHDLASDFAQNSKTHAWPFFTYKVGHSVDVVLYVGMVVFIQAATIVCWPHACAADGAAANIMNTFAAVIRNSAKWQMLLVPPPAAMQSSTAGTHTTLARGYIWAGTSCFWDSD